MRCFLRSAGEFVLAGKSAAAASTPSKKLGFFASLLGFNGGGNPRGSSFCRENESSPRLCGARRPVSTKMHTEKVDRKDKLQAQFCYGCAWFLAEKQHTS